MQVRINKYISKRRYTAHHCLTPNRPLRCTQSRQSSVDVDAPGHVRVLPGAMLPSAVNNRPMPIVVYIAFDDAGCVVAKFSKPRVWKKVPERSALIFGDILNVLKHTHNRFTALLEFVRDYRGEQVPER